MRARIKKDKSIIKFRSVISATPDGVVRYHVGNEQKQVVRKASSFDINARGYETGCHPDTFKKV